MIALIAAHDEERVIGKDQWMPWNLPEDLKHFKKITLDHDILLGRTTFEAMGKPLPRRRTFVATNRQTYQADGVTIVHDLKAFLREWQYKKAILYVCGGAKIYEQALPYAQELWISLVDGKHEGDTYFPYYDKQKYELLLQERKTGFVICHYRKRA